MYAAVVAGLSAISRLDRVYIKNLWVTGSPLIASARIIQLQHGSLKDRLISFSHAEIYFPSSIAGPKSSLMDHGGLRKQHNEAYSSRSRLSRHSRFYRHGKRCIRLPTRQSELAKRFIALEDLMQPRGVQRRQGLSFRGKWKDAYRMILLRRCLQRIENLQCQAQSKSNQLAELKERLVDRSSITPT